MRIHRHLVEAVAATLAEVFAKDLFADKVIERALQQNKKWGARDRKFFAETTYEIIRWWRRIWWAMDEEPSLEPQALFRLVGAWLALKGVTLPAWSEWARLPLTSSRERFDAVPDRAVRESVPDWLDQLGQEQLSGSWPQILAALNEPAPVFLRANRLRAAAPELQRLLSEEGIASERVAQAEEALVLAERKNVFRTGAFQQGLFEVQDLHSQKISPWLEVEPGMRVIDGCAGAGGKTLHLASLMGNKGRIVALDIYPLKLKELNRRARRAGIDIIETRLIESKKVIKRLHRSADRVLLDVPCTGLGVLRRNPDSKWKLRPERTQELQRLQGELLHQYSLMLKPGGKMVYATCSILPSENERQVQNFLQNNPDWRLEEELSTRPEANAGDGFYMARLTRD